jgi:hypothetical protein
MRIVGRGCNKGRWLLLADPAGVHLVLRTVALDKAYVGLYL